MLLNALPSVLSLYSQELFVLTKRTRKTIKNIIFDSVKTQFIHVVTERNKTITVSILKIELSNVFSKGSAKDRALSFESRLKY